MMKRLCTLLLLLLCGLTRAAEKPDIVYLLADDLGYADVGFNGGKDIPTPHLDKLAASGAVLTSYYVQHVCSPTRAASSRRAAICGPSGTRRCSTAPPSNGSSAPRARSRAMRSSP